MNSGIDEILETSPGQEYATKLRKINKWKPYQLKILLRSKGYCEYCGADVMASPDNFQTAQWDHIIPKCKGGEHESDGKHEIELVFDKNIAHSCAKCNAIKNRYLPDAFSCDDLKPLPAEKRIERIKSWVVDERGKKDIRREYYLAGLLVELVR